MNAQLTTVRDGARASASTPSRSVSDRPRVAPLGRAHRRPEDPREHDGDHEADERREDQQEHCAAARDRSGVERPAAEADRDRHRGAERGDVEQLDAPAAGLVVTRQCHPGQDERHADHRAERARTASTR